MRSFLYAAFAAVAVCAVVGCPNPRNTRFPMLAPSNPDVERRLLERHDPFPDANLGPETVQRPRGTVRQRTVPRKAYEDRVLNGLKYESVPPGQPIPPSARYPDAVPQ